MFARRANEHETPALEKWRMAYNRQEFIIISLFTCVLNIILVIITCVVICAKNRFSRCVSPIFVLLSNHFFFVYYDFVTNILRLRHCFFRVVLFCIFVSYGFYISVCFSFSLQSTSLFIYPDSSRTYKRKPVTVIKRNNMLAACMCAGAPNNKNQFVQNNKRFLCESVCAYKIVARTKDKWKRA